MRRRRAEIVAALVVALAAGAARAQDDDGEAQAESFWAGLAHPHRARYGELVAQGAAFLQGQDPAAAAPLLEQAVKLDATEPLGFYLLGVARLRLKHYGGCADALATVESLRPGYVPTGTRVDNNSVGALLGSCAMQAGRFDEAAAHYRRMLGTGEGGLPPDILHGNLADCYQALGRLDEAIEEYALAAAAAPKNAPPLFGLAVALDRDEQVARAHDAMKSALALDPQLSSLATDRGQVFFAPPEDVHYYFGLAYQMASLSDPLRRAPAIVRFRRYLGAAGQGPWVKRARAHLAELGASALGPGDVVVTPVDAPEKDAAVRAVVAVATELQRCMADDKEGVVRASVRFYPPQKAGKPAPRATPTGLVRPLSLIGPETDRVSTLALDGEPVSRQAIECIEKTLGGIKLGVRQLTLLQVGVLAR